MWLTQDWIKTSDRASSASHSSWVFATDVQKTPISHMHALAGHNSRRGCQYAYQLGNAARLTCATYRSVPKHHLAISPLIRSVSPHQFGWDLKLYTIHTGIMDSNTDTDNQSELLGQGDFTVESSSRMPGEVTVSQENIHNAEQDVYI